MHIFCDISKKFTVLILILNEDHISSIGEFLYSGILTKKFVQNVYLPVVWEKNDLKPNINDFFNYIKYIPALYFLRFLPYLDTGIDRLL